MTGRNKYVKRSRISEWKFRQLVKLFSLDLDGVQIAAITRLNRNTVNRYIKAMRNRIAEYCELESPLKGEVEIDESYFGARRVRGKSIAQLAAFKSDILINYIDQLDDRVIHGKIAEINNNKININIGSVYNVEKGMKFSIYKAFKYINYPLIGGNADKERLIIYYREKYKRFSENNKSKEWIEYLAGYSEYIQKLESGSEKIPYVSFIIPGYAVAIDVERNSTILDFQFVIDDPLESQIPEPGDEVFLLRNMENPDKLLQYLQ